MICDVDGVPVHYVEHGAGTPVIVLHGVGVDQREIEGALEPIFSRSANYRRIYPDLPGMGSTPAPVTIASNDDVLEVLLGLIDSLIGDLPFLMVGHSYGGYLARAIANRRADTVVGLALICPVGERTLEVPHHLVVQRSDEVAGILEPDLDASYRDYFVVQSPATLASFQRLLQPAIPLVSEPDLQRIFARWRLRDVPEGIAPYRNSALILTGRHDATAGYVGAWGLLDAYPRATFAVLDNAGHALLHEQPELAGALIDEWLRRVEQEDQTSIRQPNCGR